MTYLLDTNVVSEWAKPTPNEHVVHWLAVMSTIDAFLAATAAVHGLTLATRNVKDFEHAEVALIDPWQPPS